MLACLTSRERLLLGLVGLVVAATAALEYGGGSDVAVFVAAALALAGVAWVVSFSTEAVGERFGPALSELDGAWRVGDEAPPVRPLIIDRIT